MRGEHEASAEHGAVLAGTVVQEMTTDEEAASEEAGYSSLGTEGSR